MIDTETANTIENPFTYNIAYAIINMNNGKILKERSFLVKEIFRYHSLMDSAYFSEKIPFYFELLARGLIEEKSIFAIKAIFYGDCRTYNIRNIYAHNARFDVRALNKTLRYITSSRERYFIPYGVHVNDTLKMTQTLFSSDKDYTEFCHSNNYLTKHGRNKLTAECLYRYINDDNDFTESHTALEDVLIEKDILFECIKRGMYTGRLW